MKVIATATGYFGVLIEPGQTFEVPDGTKGSWFEPADDGDGRPGHAKAGKSATTTANVDKISESTRQHEATNRAQK